MVILEARAGGQRVLVARPDVSSLSSLSMGLAEIFARARQAGATTCLLKPATPFDALFRLAPADMPIVEPTGALAGWLRARYTVATAAAAMRSSSAKAMASLWREMYRELRRHVGDERLPYPLRTRLRGIADRSLAWAAAADRALPSSHSPRQLLRTPVAAVLSEAARAAARDAARRLGIQFDRPIVALETRSRVERIHGAVDDLVHEGYVVVRLGAPAMGSLQRRGVIDLTQSSMCPATVELLVLESAVFVVCESDEVQNMALLMNRPSLRLNVVDPLAEYPVRADGVFTLATVVELATGRPLKRDELHTAHYRGYMDRYAHRAGPAEDVRAAVGEMVRGVRHGWTETIGQAEYRAQITAVAEAVMPSALRASGTEPFVGDGRLARVQADRAV